MKKRVISFIIASITVAGLVACNSENGNQNKREKQIETTSQAAIKASEQSQIVLDEKEYGTIQDGIYTSIAGEFQMQVPKTWKLSEKEDEEQTVIIAGNNEDTKNRVVMSVVEKDTEFNNYTQESFEEYYSTLFEEFQMKSFERTTIAKLPAIRVVFSFNKNGGEVTQYQYMLDGNSTYMIQFSDFDGQLRNTEELCIQTLKIYR